MAIFAAGKKHRGKKGKPGNKPNLFFRLEWRKDVNPFTKIHTGAYRMPVELDEIFLLAEKALPCKLGTSADTAHPRPDDDPDIQGLWGDLSDVELKNYVFGFSSLKVLKNWFYSESGLENIEDVGCIGVYQITSEITEEYFPAYAHGKIQSIAHWKHLKRIDELSTTTKRY